MADGQERLRRYQAKYQQSLNLYGVVLEAQSQIPVAAATVVLSPIDQPGIGSQDSAPTTVQSDAQGRFSFTGHRGAYLYVQVSKPGYYALKEGSRVTFTHDVPSPGMGQQPFASDPAAPARLYLRQQGTPAANLIYHELSQRVPLDGSPSEIRLSSGHPAEIGTGDLRVECWGSGTGVPGGTPFDWRCRISVPGGGLQVRTDGFLFQAPEGGYQPGEEINMPASLGKRQWQSTARRDYFLHLANGCYARAQIEVHPDGHHLFYLTCYYNPTPADRNLEAVADTKPKDYR